MLNFKYKNKIFKSALVLFIVFVLVSQYINLSNVFGEDEDFFFSLVVLPDTQEYSAGYPLIFNQQTQWIVNNKEKLNIVFVSHLGDLIQHFDAKLSFDFSKPPPVIDIDKVWTNAAEAMSKLDDIVRYAVLPGNHDFDITNDILGRATFYNRYFPVSKHENKEWWGGNYLGNKNSYQLFSIRKMDFIILHLEYLAPDDVLFWANNVLSEYADRRVIVVTHLYLKAPSGLRSINPRFKREAGNSGEDIWNKLIKNNCNVFMVLSGHWRGEARQTSTNNCGNEVFEIVQDYSFRENGGNGWLRYFVFRPWEDKIYAFTYSPYLDQFERDEDSEFVLDYEM